MFGVYGGLGVWGATSITAAITESGPVFTESISATVNPSGVQRVFIHMTTGTMNEYTASNWNPTGSFTIEMDLAPALSTGNLFLAHVGDFEIRYVRSQNRIYCYVDDSAGQPLQFDLPVVNLIADTLYSLKIFGVVGLNTLTVELDGVDCPVTNTSTSTPDFSGTINLGTVAAGSTATMDGIIANVVLTDSGTPANSFGWAIDEATADIESSETNTKDLTYISTAQGLPTRELFTLNGAETQWDGNNGTTLLIGLAPSISASITETGPSFTESINVTVSTALVEAAITELGPSFTESITVNVSVPIEASITESGPSFTESISSSLTAKLNAAITEAGPSFTESITATVMAQGVFANITESGPSFTESIVSEISKNIITTITEQGPSFVESINVQIIKDVTVDITENGPSFTESIIASIPVLITVNPRNVVRVKRTSNNVTIKRKSNTIRVR